MGLGSLSLWTLALVRRRVGMVAWSGVWLVPSVLGSCVCVLLGLGRGFWFRLWRGGLGRLRLAPSRTVRLVSSVVGWIPWPFWRGERHQRSCDEYQSLWRDFATAWRYAVLQYRQHS